jgi:hypothetical protein
MTGPAAFDKAWMFDRISSAVTAAVDQDGETALTAILGIGERYGPSGVYAACWTIGTSIATMGGIKIEGDDEFVGLELSVAEDGIERVVNPEEIPGVEMAGFVTALRFTVAVINKDRDQALSIFQVVRDEESAIAFIIGMLNLVSSTGRTFLAQQKAGEN